jgi:hypothetical protein
MDASMSKCKNRKLAEFPDFFPELPVFPEKDGKTNFA